MRRRFRRPSHTIVVALTLLAAPATAHGATVALNGTMLEYTAGAVEENAVTFAIAGPDYLVTDTGVSAIADGDGPGGCSVTGNEATCPVAGVAGVHVTLSDLIDTATVQGATADRLDGGAGSDTLTAGAGADVLLGGDGNDVLNGESANDVLQGGTGADHYNGGAGADTASYSESNEDEIVDIGGVSDDGSADDGPAGARDTVAADVENLRGGTGNDRLNGSAQDNALDGGAGDDSLFGAGGEDNLLGRDGDDTLRGGLQADQFNGGDGVDTASYTDHTFDVAVDIDGVADDGSACCQLDGPLGGPKDNVKLDVENLRGTQDDDTLIGSAGNNRIEGLGYGDRITGGPGDDVLEGGEEGDIFRTGTAADGADLIDGGEGLDVVFYNARGDVRVNVSLDGVADDGEIFGPTSTEGDNVIDISQVWGSAGGTDFVGTDGPEQFFGAESGGVGRDVVRLGGGGDMASTSIGPDFVDGGPGNDDITASPSYFGSTDEPDRILGGTGADVLRGHVGDDAIVGGPGKDVEQGGEGADVFDQGAAASGSDIIDCGGDSAGSVDRVEYDARSISVVVRMNATTDDGQDADLNGVSEEGDRVGVDCEEVWAGRGADALIGGTANEIFDGGPGDDTLVGGSGSDVLLGRAGDDLLHGVDGFRDALSGGAGGEVAGDRGSWDPRIDSVKGMEDTDPGPGP